MRVITREYPADWDYLNLYPISDVHLGSAECMEDKIERYISKIAQDDRAAVVLAGDIINNGLKSSKTNVYEEKYPPREQKRRAIELLRPIANKIITMVPGNHERRSAKESDTDITWDMCDALGVEYVGDMAFIKISVGSKRNQKPATYSILVTHGAGGGALIGSGLNRSDKMQMAVEGLDIIISGHTHKPSKTPSARLVLDPYNNKVTVKNTLLFVCTGWLDYGGYPTQSMMPPVAFYPDHIRLNGKSKAWK